MTTQGLENYLTHLVKGLPGGVECGYCHKVDTYVHVSLKWKDLGENVYSFRQVVRCDMCGYLQGYEWEQNVKPNFGVRINESTNLGSKENAWTILTNDNT